MRSQRKGSLSAVTEVKVSSPEITHIAQGEGFHFLETSTGAIAKGKIVSGVPGSESAAGKRTAYVGTWENQIVLKRSFQGVEKMTRRYGGLVVGLTHIRGVNRVMPIETGRCRTLEGVSSITRRDEVCHAVH